MKRIITHFLAAVLLLTVMGTGKALAQFSDGKVYRIECSGTNTVSLGASALTDVAAVATSETDRSQQWYVKKNGDNYTFRNLANGRYLQGNNSMSSDWRLTETSNDFTVTTVSNNYCIRQVGHTNGYAYMHKDAGNNIVSWESSAVNSQWTPVEVAYTAEQLQAVWDAVDALVVSDAMVEGYQAVLDAVFTDKACTQLNSTYASMIVDQIKADANFKTLPAALQAMVLKVKGGNWSEANAVNGKEGWSHDYAKRFRVQMYEPYSVEGEITSYLRINAHSNMDNPTGIYANAGEPVYIMVDGDIADGAELWVAHQAGLGATQKYNNVAHTQLHKGLNVVPYFSDASTLWIDYVVHTYDADGATLAEKFPHKISDYSPLKIHIEGGHINGFFNAIGDFRATTDAEDLWGAVDNDEDWNYYKERAPLNGTDAPNRDFPLLGSRQTLLFPLGKQANEGGTLEEGMLYHLDCVVNNQVPYEENGVVKYKPAVLSTPNCYGGNGKSFGDYSETYYPGLGLNASTGKINIMIEAWDRIMYTELATMGLVSKSTMERMNSLYPRWTSEGTPAEIYDYKNAGSLDGKTYLEFCGGIDYSEYFNHHGAAVGAPSGYMSGGWRNCNYHYNTMGSVIGVIAAEAGPTWGPAHEIGHQHQGVFNLHGQTEVTNNFFSNVAVWYMGMGTSRVNGNCGSLESLLRLYNDKESCMYERLTDGDNIWAFVQMYHKLWLYYHLAGNNTQFWPRMFELCRQEPLVNGKEIDGETSLLRFYKHACNAAGEDLTEFFRAHGYLNVMDNVFVEDYTSAIYNMTQAQIDAAINEVKAKKYPVNYAVLFINDATGDTTPKHDGKTKRALWDGSATAELGCVNDFISGNVATTAYTATLNSDGTITMSGGEGGVGFLVLNENCEIVSFSNKSTFALGEEARHSLISGAATIVSVSSDNSEPVEATIDLAFVKKEILSSLIDEARAVVEGVDNTYTKVGCYKPSAVTDLQAAIEVAEDAYANGTAFEGAYEVLYAEYRKVIDNPVSMIGVISGKKYAIKNKGGNDYMTVNGSNVVTTGNSTIPTTDANLWIIETAGENYHIKHAGTGKYLQGVSDDNGVNFTVGDNAVDYKMTTVAIAYNALSTVEHPGKYMNRYNSNRVATWGNTDANSQWMITLVDGAADAENLANLELLASKTRELLDKVADVEYTGEGYPLQAEDPSASFYITSNATESGHEPKFLLDNSTSTFFHTVWAGGSPGEAHYLQVDMGADNAIGEFVLSYTTIGQTNVDAPEVIEVKGSNSPNSGFQSIATLSSLPTTHVTPYTSGVLGNDNTKYRYLRFTVTDATGGQLGGYYYFGISELVIKRMNYQLNGIHSDYSDVTTEIVTAAIEKYEAAKLAIANGSGYDTALSQLQTAYDALYDASLTVFNAKKAELQKLIEATKELINSVASITTAKSEELALQVSNPSGAYYLSTNSQENAANRNISKLVDGVTNNGDSYFHTDWQNSVGADHHLLLDMGNGNSLGEFTFKYTTRNNSAGVDAPRTIVVEGSNDNSGFTQIAELTDLPTGQHQTYESAVLGNNATKYRYIRFRVTDGAGKVGNYYYFAMSEFDVTAVGGTTVTVKDEYKANVTEELFVATNNKVVDAETLMNNTTSIELLDAMTAELQAAYDALCRAANSHTLEVGSAGWATLFLGNNTLIPAGVEAFIVSKVDGSSVILTKVEGVLPALQGVIVKADAGKYDFDRTADVATSDFTGNLLKGTLVDTYVEGEAYVLSNGVSGIGFYKAKLNKDAEGNKGTTHFKNNAGKAYLVLPAAENSAAYYGFDWAGTTEISEVKGENVEVETIYDLTGRKLKGENGNLKGVYIINGKKVLVK